jgi:hypothetical protein
MPSALNVNGVLSIGIGGNRVVKTKVLQDVAIAGAARISDGNSVARSVTTTCALHADDYGHGRIE